MNHLTALPVTFGEGRDAHAADDDVSYNMSPSAFPMSTASIDDRIRLGSGSAGTPHIAALAPAYSIVAPAVDGEGGCSDSDWESPPALAISAAKAAAFPDDPEAPIAPPELALDTDELEASADELQGSVQPPMLALDIDGLDYASPPPALCLSSAVMPTAEAYDWACSAERGLAAIVDGVLFLGSFRDTVDAAECARLGVGAFLCVAAECGPPPHARQSGAPTLHLRLVDEPRERLADHTAAACAFIDAQAAAGRRTAIFCRKGRSRSVALCAAYVRHRGLAPCGASALEYVAARYPRGDPNFWFLQQLGATPETVELRPVDHHTTGP